MFFTLANCLPDHNFPFYIFNFQFYARTVTVYGSSIKLKIKNVKWKIMVGKTICKSEKHCRPTVFVYMEVVANLYERILYACR